ncbi:peptidoglycan editing factor PgeF [Paenibacillus sp. GCM10023252]|uniref:peptidoglycan editing factor PgeF n=1 Tax=Paenibacillus sp. GCM10023252 TaxID=3252649 RepID=UPI003612DF23
MEPFVWSQSAKDPSLFLLSSWMSEHEGLTAGFTGRSGGVSKGRWSSLNTGLHVGDLDEDVVQNRKRVTAAIGWPHEAWTCAEQVHGSRVYEVLPADRGKGRASRADAIQDTDALMTNVRGVLLASLYADCVPLYFYDPEHQAMALAHAGWKGTVLEIAARTLEAMAARYGTRPEAVRAAIGPSIGGCCYEVDAVVIDRVKALLPSFGLSDEEQALLLLPVESGKAMVDLREINRQIMIKAGIMPIHIECTQWCTGCRRDLFFSHRMEGGPTGRMASWIGLAP